MNNKKNVLLAVLIVGIVAMTVAFAALSTNLRISGTASVPSTTWNIHFQNWALDTASTVTEGGITHQNTAEYPTVAQLSQTLSPNITKVDDLDVTLYQPGDYAKYTFQIINEGSIDASLDTFTHNLTCASGNDCSHLSYTVECVDSNSNNVLIGHPTLTKNGGLAYCTLQVKYLDQTNQNTNTAGSVQTYTRSAAHATLDATWVYVQKVDSQAQSGSGSGNQEPVTPSNPYETTFDGNYVAYYWIGDSEGYEESNNENYSGWYTTLNPESNIYLRTDGTTNETCGVFESGTVCATSDENGRSSDFEEVGDSYYGLTTSSELAATGLKGYSLAKAEEMLSAGASSCDVSYYERVSCNSEDSDVVLSIEYDGYATSMNTYCNFQVNPNGFYHDCG